MKYLSSFVVLGSAIASLAAAACTDSSSVGTVGTHGDAGTDGGDSAGGGGSGSGSGGGTSTGGSSSSGGAGGASSAGGKSGTGGSGAGTDGGATDGGSSADPCSGPDGTEPNESRDDPTAYTLGSSVVGCVKTASDHDFYEFTVPADAAGGYVQIALGNVGDGYADLHVYSASDNGEINDTYAGSRGQTVNAFLAVAKGQKYRLDVTDFSGFDAAYAYTLKATYTSIADTFEPNDARDAAKAITKGTPIDAFIFAGYTEAPVPPDTAYDDWYSVTLAAGAATAKIENVPTDVYGDLKLFNSGGTELGHEYAASEGASVTLTYTVVTAGSYFVKVGAFGSIREPSGDTAAVVDRFTRKYKLTVSQ